MPAPSRMRDTPTTNENTPGFGAPAAGRNVERNRLKRSMRKPKPIRARLLRCHASSVRSAENNTRGSAGADMMKPPRFAHIEGAPPHRDKVQPQVQIQVPLTVTSCTLTESPDTERVDARL